MFSFWQTYRNFFLPTEPEEVWQFDRSNLSPGFHALPHFLGEQRL
jgi:hypothetical protein